MKIYKAIIEDGFGEVISEDYFIKKDKSIKYLKKWLTDYQHSYGKITEDDIVPIESYYSITFIDNKTKKPYPVSIDIIRTLDTLISMED